MFRLLLSVAAQPSAVTFQQESADGRWGTYVLIIVLLLFGAALVARQARRESDGERQARALSRLEGLGRALLNALPDESLLPDLLSLYVPAVFGSRALAVLRLPDQILYQQGRIPDGELDRLWEQLRNAPEDVADDSEGFASEGQLKGRVISVRHPGEGHVLGALWLGAMQPPAAAVEESGGPPDPLSLARSLAGQLGAFLHQIEANEQIRTAQMEALRREVYKQVYQVQIKVARQQVNQELALAGRIQATFLPRQVPEVPGWEMTYTLRPAREASGDYYDFIELPGERTGLLVADVADKGIGAALYMALSRTLIRTYAQEFSDRPAEALAAANYRIRNDTSSDLFVTVFYAVLDHRQGTLTYCNAGHNPPFLFGGQPKPGSDPKELTRTALPLGIFEDMEAEQSTVEITSGEVLLMYTDGITEAENDDQGFFGAERLKGLAVRNVDRPVMVIAEKIFKAVDSFVDGAPQQDDMTLVVVGRQRG